MSIPDNRNLTKTDDVRLLDQKTSHYKKKDDNKNLTEYTVC